MRKILILLLCLGLFGCATLPRPAITNSVGSPDLARYKTFSVFNTSTPNTPQFLRDTPILQNIIFRFQQEGFEFIDNPEKTDFIITESFMDAVGQKYIPPHSFTSVYYNSYTNTATATTITTGGYYVPTYGVALALNIYDGKTKQLVWSGAGATGANISFIDPAIDNIILSIIDAQLITPVYIKGNRKEIRKAATEIRSNEYLKPDVSSDKIGFFQVDYKDELDNFKILCRLSYENNILVLSLSLVNKTGKDFEFDPTTISVTCRDKKLYIPTKSEVTSALFKLRNVNPKIDETVRFTYEHYLDKHTIKPNEPYLGYLYLMPPLGFSSGEKISVTVPLLSKNAQIDFIYQRGWMTTKQFKKKFKKYM